MPMPSDALTPSYISSPYFLAARTATSHYELAPWGGSTEQRRRPGKGPSGYFSAFSASSRASSRALLASMSRAMEPGMARPIFL